jgi:hypothetical protein
MDYVVEERDENGEPSVIERVSPSPYTPWLQSYHKTIPKKQIKEQWLLKAQDQARLRHLFELPRHLEAAREKRIEAGEALHKALVKVTRQPKSVEKEEKPTSKPAPTTTVSSHVVSPTVSNYILKRPASNVELTLWVSLMVFFFALALSEEFQAFVVRRIIVDVLIDTIAPPLLDAACSIGEASKQSFPTASKIFFLLYTGWKIWATVGAIWYLCRKAQEIFGDCAISVDTLGRKAPEILGQMMKFVGKYLK